MWNFQISSRILTQDILTQGSFWLKLFHECFVLFLCISSKSSIAFCQGSQGMTCGRFRWMGPDHPRTAITVSSITSSIAGVSSGCGTESVSSAAEVETSCCEDVRHTSVWRPPSEGRGSRRTGHKVGICSRGVAWCGGTGSRHSSSCVETGQGGEEGFPVGRADHTVRGFLVQSPDTSDRVGAKRAVVSANIQEAAQRLEALKVQQQQFVAAPPPPFDTESELRQLRETVAQLKGQLIKPAATSEGPVSKRVCRREEFIPNCMEEMQEWIGGRQADIHEALVAGRPDEVARISDIVCQAAHQWEREVSAAILPSMVTNSEIWGLYMGCAAFASARRRTQVPVRGVDDGWDRRVHKTIRVA